MQRCVELIRLLRDPIAQRRPRRLPRSRRRPPRDHDVVHRVALVRNCHIGPSTRHPIHSVLLSHSHIIVTCDMPRRHCVHVNRSARRSFQWLSPISARPARATRAVAEGSIAQRLARCPAGAAGADALRRGRGDVRGMKLSDLTALFRKLGAPDPGQWARPQRDEGIDQVARFVFLRQAWKWSSHPTTRAGSTRRSPASSRGVASRVPDSRAHALAGSGRRPRGRPRARLVASSRGRARGRSACRTAGRRCKR
jgi:hypothetical protein